jgi:hypothetical protein
MSIWMQDVDSSFMAAIMCKENDQNLGCITLSGGYRINVASGSRQFGRFDMLPTFGGVVNTGSPTNNRRVVIYAFQGGYIEWALWHQGSYTSGESPPGGESYVTFPDAKVFMILIWRMNVEPQSYERKYVGLLLCREDSDWLGCMFHTSGAKADTLSSTVGVLNQISAIGGVRTTGNPSQNRVMRLYAAPYNAIEGAYWTEGTYTAYDTTGTWDFTFAHYRFFVFVAARYGRLIWLFCRENDNTLGCAPLRWF